MYYVTAGVCTAVVAFSGQQVAASAAPVMFCSWCHCMRHTGNERDSVLRCRFRVLAEHFLTMYPNLNVDIDGELEQLKVKWSPGVAIFDGIYSVA